MPCSPLTDPECVEPVDHGSHPFGPPLPDLAGEIGGNALDGAAKAMQEAVGWFVSHTATWWLRTPSPNLEKESAIEFLQNVTRPLTIAVAIASLLFVAGKMALVRKSAPLVDAGTGLAALVVVTVIGTMLPNILLRWGDVWTDWVLKAAADDGFSSRMTKLVALPAGAPAAFVLVMSLIALFVGIIQAILLLFRHGALIVLVGMLPLAAAGMATSATRPWLKRAGGWTLALVFYKPIAGGVYATAFILIGHGTGMRAILLGHTMMLISLFAFPVLLQLFSWITPGQDGGGGGGRVFSAVIGGATAVGALRSYGLGGTASSGGAAGHADYLNQQLGDRRGDPAPSGSDEPGNGPANDAPPGTVGDAASQPEGGPPSDGSSPAAGEEPLGPTALRAWNRSRKQGRTMIRWIGNPTGNDDGAPTGAGEGGGGG